MMRSRLGLVVYTCGIRRAVMRSQNPMADLFEPLTFLKHCQTIGAGGMQLNLGTLNAQSVRRLREYAEKHDLHIEGIINPPKSATDLMRFEAEVKTAMEVGANCVRTVIMPGRRYEQFATLEEFREAEAQGKQMLEWAGPIITKYRIRLAVENHKDQRLDERIALLKHFESEYIGVCLDTGNSFALLDGVYEPVETLAPYAFTVHLKDQALQEYEQGFLLGDIPLGQGCFDLKRMVSIIKKAKPDVRFNLELITRDALRIPCLADRYWVTMPNVSKRDRDRALQFVRDHPAEHMQSVSNLTSEQRMELEDQNITASLKYSQEVLEL